jgi:hypothetical protein
MVNDNSGNVHILLRSQFFQNEEQKFSFYTFNKINSKITRSVDFASNDFQYYVSLASDKKGAFLISETLNKLTTDQLKFNYYDFEKREVAEVDISSGLLTDGTKEFLLIPVRSSKEPLVKLIKLAVGGRTAQSGIYRISNDAQLEPIFKEKAINNGFTVQDTPDGLMSLELDAIGDDRNQKIYLLIHKSLNEIVPVLLTSGTGRFLSRCYY